MPTLPRIHYTVKDYEQWQGDWELIEGMPVAMSPAPVLTHQRVNFLIMMALEESLKDCDQCRVIPEAEWRLDHDTALRPDGVVICYKPECYLTRAPEIVVEVLSPSTAELDEHYKFERYAIEGVRHYLLVDPDTLRVRHFIRNDQGRFIIQNDLEKTGQLDLSLSTGCTANIDFDRVFDNL